MMNIYVRKQISMKVNICGFMIFPKLDSDAMAALQSVILLNCNEGTDMLYRPKPPYFKKCMGLISLGVYHCSPAGIKLLILELMARLEGKSKPTPVGKGKLEIIMADISLTYLAPDAL